MVNVWIDEFTPCLKDTLTGDIIETEVVQVTRKSFLSKYKKANGWYVDWEKLLAENEVFALVVKGTADIQGMVALSPNSDYQAIYINWMCAAPCNNKEIVSEPKYQGVGGHLFAIAIDKSFEYGFDGVVTGFAANADLLMHYVDVFEAFPLRALHPYHFVIEEMAARRIKGVYTYEWTEAKL